MTADISKSLERIRETAETLNKHGDWINGAIATVEQRLRETNAGLEAEVFFNGSNGCKWALQYKRIAGKFHIAIRERNWSCFKRADKLFALQALPALVEKLATLAELENGSVNELRLTTRAIVGSLVEPDATPPKPDTAALLEAMGRLRGYVEHKPGCNFYRIPEGCDCGLRKADEAYQALKGQA